MKRKDRALGTNRDMAHHQMRRPRERREPSDRQLLVQARRATAAWQQRLEKQRRAEAAS